MKFNFNFLFIFVFIFLNLSLTSTTHFDSSSEEEIDNGIQAKDVCPKLLPGLCNGQSCTSDSNCGVGLKCVIYFKLLYLFLMSIQLELSIHLVFN